jgi:hypothetical protein
MSIDRFVYAKPDPKSPTGRTYNWATVREITDDLNNNHGGKEYGLHTVWFSPRIKPSVSIGS